MTEIPINTGITDRIRRTIYRSISYSPCLLCPAYLCQIQSVYLSLISGQFLIVDHQSLFVVERKHRLRLNGDFLQLIVSFLTLYQIDLRIRLIDQAINFRALYSKA